MDFPKGLFIGPAQKARMSKFIRRELERIVSTGDPRYHRRGSVSSAEDSIKADSIPDEIRREYRSLRESVEYASFPDEAAFAKGRKRLAELLRLFPTLGIPD